VHASQSQHSEFAEDVVVGERAGASSLHLVPSAEEVSNAITNVIVDRPVGVQPGAVAEVRRPW
jgi:hypothetical protein